jgi:hypothetical protein
MQHLARGLELKLEHKGWSTIAPDLAFDRQERAAAIAAHLTQEGSNCLYVFTLGNNC